LKNGTGCGPTCPPHPTTRASDLWFTGGRPCAWQPTEKFLALAHAMTAHIGDPPGELCSLSNAYLGQHPTVDEHPTGASTVADQRQGITHQPRCRRRPSFRGARPDRRSAHFRHPSGSSTSRPPPDTHGERVAAAQSDQPGAFLHRRQRPRVLRRRNFRAKMDHGSAQSRTTETGFPARRRRRRRSQNARQARPAFGGLPTMWDLCRHPRNMFRVDGPCQVGPPGSKRSPEPSRAGKGP